MLLLISTTRADDEPVESAVDVVTPGEMVTDDPVWMRGHGTYSHEDQTFLAVAGVVLRVQRLLSVEPLRGRYVPTTGDHVVGRITLVGNKRWKVDIGGRTDAVLMLGLVNLPGGVLRRKSESDELAMRGLLKEGDLLNCEVQLLYQDGAAALHTRSLKYGKLRNGVFVKVPLALVVRTKSHSHTLPGGVLVILGVNGYVWLLQTLEAGRDVHVRGGALAGASGSYAPGQALVLITRLEEELLWEIYSDQNDVIRPRVREAIARYRNCILALAHCGVGLTEERVVAAYDASLARASAGDLVEREAMEEIGEGVLNMEKMRGG